MLLTSLKAVLLEVHVYLNMEAVAPPCFGYVMAHRLSRLNMIQLGLPRYGNKLVLIIRWSTYLLSHNAFKILRIEILLIQTITFHQMRNFLDAHFVITSVNKVVALGQTLLQAYSRLDFAVSSLGQSVGLPNWVVNLRSVQIDESIERAWCERYTASYVVIGVHGSNMLLSLAHAGTTVSDAFRPLG